MLLKQTQPKRLKKEIPISLLIKAKIRANSVVIRVGVGFSFSATCEEQTPLFVVGIVTISEVRQPKKIPI